MPRPITTHIVNPSNDRIGIEAIDEPGPGGAHHVYRFTFKNEDSPSWQFDIAFQKGPIAEAGVNGFTNEALLAIVRDRLDCFQGGKFACEENAQALTYITMGMDALLNRTRARMARGVEGTMKP